MATRPRRKSRTLSFSKLRRMRRQEGEPRPDELEFARPRTRADCRDGPRPCPFLGCRYHLGLHVRFNGLTLNYPGDDPSDMQETCALDVADRGPVSQQEVARLLGLSRARVNDVEVAALKKLRAAQAALQTLHAELGQEGAVCTGWVAQGGRQYWGQIRETFDDEAR